MTMIEQHIDGDTKESKFDAHTGAARPRRRLRAPRGHMDYPEATPRIRNYLAVLWRARIVQSGDREAMFTSSNPSSASSSPAPRAGS